MVKFTKYILFLFLISCSSDLSTDVLAPHKVRSKADEVYQKGLTWRQGSEKQQELMDSAIRIDPTHANVLFERSVWFGKSGRVAKQREYLLKAVELDPEAHLGYLAWVELYQNHNYEGCLKTLARLNKLLPQITSYPWGVNEHYIKGICKMRLERYDDAILSFNDNIRTDSTKVGAEWVGYRVYLMRGISHLLNDNPEFALVDFEKVLEMYEEYADAWYWKGKALQKLEKNRKAELAFKWALDYRQHLNRDPYRRDFYPVYTALIEKEIISMQEK